MSHIHPRYIIGSLIALIVGLIAALSYVFITDTNSPQTQEALSAQAIVAICKDGNRGNISKAACYSKAFENLAKQEGPQAAFDTLFTVQSIDRDALGCHFIGHGIGYGTYARSPDTWRQDFRNINQACTYGAMHGILEMAVADLPNGLTRENLPSICGDDPRGDCNHIVGHLTLLETEGDIDSALEMCKALQKERQRQFCFTGVFMENITAVNLVEHGYADQSYLNWPARIPEMTSMCQSYSDLAHTACWKETAHALQAKHRRDAGAIFTACDRAHEASARRSCKTHSVGILAAAYNFNLSQARAMCQASGITDEFAKTCRLQLVTSTLSTDTGKAESALEYCSTLTSTEQVACARLAGNVLENTSSVSAEQLQSVCANAPSQRIVDACRTGGPVQFNPHDVHSET